LSVADASDADDETSSVEAPAVTLSHSSLATSITPPLQFPVSPDPYEDIPDDGFHMDGYDQQLEVDQQSEDIPGWYATQEEVRSSPFNALEN